MSSSSRHDDQVQGSDKCTTSDWRSLVLTCTSRVIDNAQRKASEVRRSTSQHIMICRATSVRHSCLNPRHLSRLSQNTSQSLARDSQFAMRAEGCRPELPRCLPLNSAPRSGATPWDRHIIRTSGPRHRGRLFSAPRPYMAPCLPQPKAEDW